MIEFISIGFDVKVWPWNGPMTPDETGWEQNDAVRTKLEKEFAVVENEYQVLTIDDCGEFLTIVEIIRKRSDANILVVRFPKSKVKAHDEYYGYTTSETELPLFDFAFRGYDVCDFDGLFSVLFHPELMVEKNAHGLIANLDQAIELIDIADRINIKHKPHVVAEILTLK